MTTPFFHDVEAKEKDGGELLSMPRSIPLKNASIEAILDFEPAAPLGPTYPKTRKGRVRHLRPDSDSQRRQHEDRAHRQPLRQAERVRVGEG